MSYQLNGKLAALKAYDPICGDYPVRLDANESCLRPSPQLRQKMAQAMADAAFNRYPDPLSEKVCAAFAGAYGVPARCVTAGNGSDELISVLLSSFLEKGDALLTLSPDFGMYAIYASVYEDACVVEKKDGDFRITGAQIAAAAQRANARAVIFSNPCNPTSLGLERDEVRALLRGTDALVVLDEAYMDFWDQSLLREVGEYDNLVILRTCSKALGLANIRLGFAVANERITDALRAAKAPYNVNGLSAAAGAVVLSEPGYLRESVARLLASRDALAAKLERILSGRGEAYRIFPSCTNFLYVRMPDARAVFEALKARGIIVRCFEGHLRITAGSESENEALAAALCEILE